MKKKLIAILSCIALVVAFCCVGVSADASYEVVMAEDHSVRTAEEVLADYVAFEQAAHEAAGLEYNVVSTILPQSRAVNAACNICGSTTSTIIQNSKLLNTYQQRECAHGYPTGVDLYTIMQSWSDVVCNSCGNIMDSTSYSYSYSFYQCKGQYAK